MLLRENDRIACTYIRKAMKCNLLRIASLTTLVYEGAGIDIMVVQATSNLNRKPANLGYPLNTAISPAYDSLKLIKM
jgi:hypothetical protein